MSNPSDEQRKYQRRDFLRLLSTGAFALATGDVLAGCGGGGGGGGPTNNINRTVSGTVNLAQIGGSGLTVPSIYQTTNIVVTASGKANVPTSLQGAQIHSVVDSQGKLRALALSTPGGTGNLTFDAASTALGLVFMTPGLATSNVSDATQRWADIMALASFAPLSAFLTQKLPNSSLDELQIDAVLDGLKGVVISDWQQQHGRATGSAGFSANCAATPSPLDATVNIENAAWRSVSVVRQTLDAASPPIAQSANKPFTVDGATAVSLGSILFGIINRAWLL